MLDLVVVKTDICEIDARFHACAENRFGAPVRQAVVRNVELSAAEPGRDLSPERMRTTTSAGKTKKSALGGARLHQ